jgi:hypothetical protein
MPHNLTKISENAVFLEIIKKVTLSHKINTSERIYILSLAILFLQEFISNKNYTTYLDFSYYLFLNYSILS